ncbi:hypothetical protein [Candidatus Methanoperedens sp. BLZ2]|uniref:hypothetical protein n=1 Tax=Candidatus Methanoperedens sp. BLZ2 TaxID=2035255 RepID=UPI0038D0B265
MPLESKKAFGDIFNGTVSILVLMDVPLEFRSWSCKIEGISVSILVLMDVPLESQVAVASVNS